MRHMRFNHRHNYKQIQYIIYALREPLHADASRKGSCGTMQQDSPNG